MSTRRWTNKTKSSIIKTENDTVFSARERMKPVPLSLFTTGIYGYLDFVLIGWTLGLVWLAVLELVTS